LKRLCHLRNIREIHLHTRSVTGLDGRHQTRTRPLKKIVTKAGSENATVVYFYDGDKIIDP